MNLSHLSKYIYILFAKIFICTQFLLAVILWVIKLSSLASIVPTLSLPQYVVFIYPIPYIVFSTMPIAFLIALYGTIAYLDKEGIMMSLFGLGYSINAMYKVIFGCGIVVSAIHYYLTFGAIAQSYEALCRVKEEIARDYAANAIRRGGAFGGSSEIFCHKHAKGIVLVDRSKNKRNMVIAGDYEVLYNNKGTVLIKMQNGTLYENEVDSISSSRKSVAEFKALSLELPIDKILRLTESGSKGGHYKEFSIKKLLKVSRKVDTNGIAALIYRLIWPFSSIIIAKLIGDAMIVTTAVSRKQKVGAVVLSIIMLLMQNLILNLGIKNVYAFTFIIPCLLGPIFISYMSGALRHFHFMRCVSKAVALPYIFITIFCIFLFRWCPAIDLMIAGLVFKYVDAETMQRINHVGRYFAILAGLSIGFMSVQHFVRHIFSDARKAFVGLYVIAITYILPVQSIHVWMKKIFHRARPIDIQTYPEVHMFSSAWEISGTCLDSCSFVSSHTAIMFATCYISYFFNHRLSKSIVSLSLLLGVLMGASRIVSGQHFFSDTVFAGIIIYWAYFILNPKNIAYFDVKSN